MSGAVARWIEATQAQIDQVVFGVGDAAEAIAMARLAGGHVLLEGVPGIGKTLLARTSASVFGGEFARVQCTPDLMPSDVVGTTIYEAEAATFRFRPGPVFADLLLVDEINRTGPRTQSALLEAMEERAVTVDGERHALPPECMVGATQNPIEFEGTYPRPESQIDRFLIRLQVAYPEAAVEKRILSTYARTDAATTGAAEALDAALLAPARAEIDAVAVEDALLAYVVELAAASRRHEDLVLGLSTRGARALLLMARVAACAAGESFVRPDDVKRVAPWVLPHRLQLTPDAQLDGRDGAEVCDALLTAVAVPR
ncbi:MAG: MoxR family ATPase [Pseudomonadales bacterium]|nr:MoxR family ATPase [Pseudomonadales bacterium]